jgi:phosphinothricin acetyltransferase
MKTDGTDGALTDGSRGQVRAATGTSPFHVRDAGGADAAAIQAIYAFHVLSSTSTFEESPPDLAEMTRRRDFVASRSLPFLVAAGGDGVLGYAYAAPFRQRSAYRYTVEDSIYVHPDATGRGIGRLLLGVLIERCTDLGYRQMVAVIGGADNFRSIRLHAGLGFVPAGALRAAGFKFGRWLDSVYMQRALGDGDRSLPER